VNRPLLTINRENGERRYGDNGVENMHNTPQTYGEINHAQQVVWENVPRGKTTVTVGCVYVLGIGESVKYALAWSLE